MIHVILLEYIGPNRDYESLNFDHFELQTERPTDWQGNPVEPYDKIVPHVEYPSTYIGEFKNKMEALNHIEKQFGPVRKTDNETFKLGMYEILTTDQSLDAVYVDLNLTHETSDSEIKSHISEVSEFYKTEYSQTIEEDYCLDYLISERDFLKGEALD